jgi:hypothetical protein
MRRPAACLVTRLFRPLLQNARPLPDGQPDPRPVFDSSLKHRLSPKKTVASIEHALDLAAVLGPLLDLKVAAVVCQQRLVGFFVRHPRHLKPARSPHPQGRLTPV